MHGSTRKWLTIKVASGILIPFMFWFIINFVSIFDSNHSQLIEFFSQTNTKVLFSLFLVLAFIFFSLTISEIFEDYISGEKYEMDLYLPDIDTIIEIDGPQHFMPVFGEKHLREYVKHDAIKNGIMIKNGYCVIRINHELYSV